MIATGHGPIWMSNVKCVGNETHLSQCEHENISASYSGYDDSGLDSCSHHEDVGVTCHIPDLKTSSRVNHSYRFVLGLLPDSGVRGGNYLFKGRKSVILCCGFFLMPKISATDKKI